MIMVHARKRRAGKSARPGYYHFYLLDNEGKVYSAATMHCGDDSDALDRAPFELQRSAWHPVELVLQAAGMEETPAAAPSR